MSRLSRSGMEREVQDLLRRLDRIQKNAEYWLQPRNLESIDHENLQSLWGSLNAIAVSLDEMLTFQPTLMRALEGTEPVSRCYAAAILSRLGIQIKISTLLSILEESFASTEVACRRHAARMMFDLKGKGVPLLSRALIDKDEHVRNWGLRLAQAIGKEALPALPALLELVRQSSQTSGAEIPNIQLRAEACDLIADFGSAAANAAKVLLAVSDERLEVDDNRYLRLRAVRALHLVSSNAKQVIKVASEILDAKVGTIMVDEQGQPIDDGGYWPRVWACDLLAELGKEAIGAAPKLEKLLKEEENATVRAAAEEALKAMGK